MNTLTVRPAGPLRGHVRVPGDKSISHRALLLGALAERTSRVGGFLAAGVTRPTLDCVRALGIGVEVRDPTLTIHGRGLRGLRAPAAALNCARSAATMRLLAGILVGQPFDSLLDGDEQLRQRPMDRLVEPLRQMGAEIDACGGHAPLTIRGRPLCGREHHLALASAQVKSAILLAGLFAEGATTIHEPGPARDHTERMLTAMGADIQKAGRAMTLHPGHPLSPLSLRIPGDLSSAAFLLVAATLVPGSAITIEGVGVNPTRSGLVDLLQEMGARVTPENEREQGNEPVADLAVRASDLVGVEVGGETAVRMIDEFPVLAVAATQARGITVVRDAAELRVKESDRIAAIVTELRALGADIEPLDDGFVVEGPTRLRGALVDSHGDHRLAMALAVAGLVVDGEVTIVGADCMAESFPGFAELLRDLSAGRRPGR